jgi:1,4-dihydroxy-2-naphthoyl-CoA synthase
MSDHYININDLPDDMREWLEHQIHLYHKASDYERASIEQETQVWLDHYAPDEEMAATAVVIASKACCQENLRDAIGVTAFTPQFSKRRFFDSSGDQSMRGVIVCVFDEHSHATVEALIDVEDAKQVVNHMMVAIAAAEGRS